MSVYTSNETRVNTRSASIAIPESEVLSSFSNTANNTGISAPAGPRYVYYRLYAEDGPIESANPVYTDDKYLGRLPAKLVAPPHTAMSLKRCLSRIENINPNVQISLFIATSSQTPIDDAGCLSILAYPGPGCTPNEPMALVATLTDTDRSRLDVKRPEAILLPAQEGETPFEMQYCNCYNVRCSYCTDQLFVVYYRVYQDHSAVLSKQPVETGDPSVGRINVDAVPAPHTALSIMQCIAKAENLDNSKPSQLFASISSTSPIGEEHISILIANRPGSSLEDPMAYVEFPALVTAPMTAPVATIIPTLDLPVPVVPTQYAPFITKQMRVTGTDCQYDSEWLDVEAGEIVHIAQPWPRWQACYNNDGEIRTFNHFKT